MPDGDLKYITTCRVKMPDGTDCGQKFTDHPLAVPIIGEEPDARTQRFVKALGKHLQSKHGQHAMATEQLGKLFQGYLICKSFETEDPSLRQAEESLRWQVHQLTMRLYVTDDQITDAVARLDAEGFTPERIRKALKEMRDALTETRKPAQEQAEQPVQTGVSG